MVDIVRSTVVFIGFDASGRSKPLPYRRILSVGVGAYDDPNIIKLIFAKAKIYRNYSVRVILSGENFTV